jgi:two-component system chemotaxis response regulator CheY
MKVITEDYSVETTSAKKILVVDDSAVITFLWKLVLEKEGYQVTQVNDGARALQKLAEGRYDCLIVDYHMDNMDGLALGKRVRAMPDYRQIPIIMITADCNDQVREGARQAGLSAWMTKPVNPDSLLEIVNHLCPLTSG